MTSISKTITQAFEKDESHVHLEIKAKPYSNPYLVGIGLGLVLLAAFVIMGRGLGASGAVSTAVAVTVNTVAPSHAANNHFYSEYLGDGKTSPFKDWLVFEVLGVIVGGFISGSLAHRVKKSVDRGPQVSNRTRLIYAFVGGGLMGIGAKLARGCTSGQALSGGALLNLGSWAFMMMVFAGGYAAAYFIRRQWL
jgi:uncharacterized membrane protein YedE/YeeE